MFAGAAASWSRGPSCVRGHVFWVPAGVFASGCAGRFFIGRVFGAVRGRGERVGVELFQRGLVVCAVKLQY